MEYLTNEKLLKQQQSALFSMNNSRSNSVSRFPIPSQRNSHDQQQPLRSADLFNRLEDILKQKQQSVTTRKKQKQISCILSSQPSHEGKRYNIENSCYKSPNRLIEVPTTGFLNVYNIDTRSRKCTQPAYIGSPAFYQQHQSGKKKTNANNYQETENKLKKESLKKFKDEFNNMQEKIKSRNHSMLLQVELDNKVIELKENKVEYNTNDNKTLNKLNQQLQVQNSHLQEQLLFEQNQNSKLNLLITNLNEQVTALNKQLNQQQLQFSDESQQKEKSLQDLTTKYQNLEETLKNKDKQIVDFLQKIQSFENVYKDMQELENLCQQMSYLGMQIVQHHQLVTEMNELFQVQNNILEKVINKKDFPIDQLIVAKNKKKTHGLKNQDCLAISQQTTDILENLVRQARVSVDSLTERFIHDLLDEEQASWKNQLEATCSGVKEEMCWAEPILIQLKDLRCSNKYQKSLHIWAQSFESSTMYPNSKSSSKSSSKYQTRNVDTIIRRTGFTEEDLIENYVKPNRNSFNGSIQSVTPSYIYHEKTSNAGLGQSSAMFEDQLAFFVQVTDQMKSHFEQQNELAIMISQFRTALIIKHKNSQFECLHEQLTLFCRTLYETLVVYYDLITLKKKYASLAILINEDTILNFIVNYVMSDQGIYSLIYNSIDKQLQQTRNKTETCLRKLKTVSIKDMGIAQEFQLVTVQEPYKEAILLLQKMNKKLGPSSKVKLIIKCSQFIQATIREVNYTRGSSLLMQADDLIPIMKYILVRAQIYDIDIQLTYIEKLITNGMLNSSSGYYVITMLAALSSIRDQLIQ